jgi:NitT/TauT family transport system substrate-binding protein
MKRISSARRLLGAAAVLALAAAWGAGAAEAAETIHWLNDWLPAGDKGVIYYGVQKGIFSAAGFDVQIGSGRGSSDVVTKLASGSAEFGTGGLAALLQARAESPADVVAVASIYTKQPDAIFTVEGSGINSLKDLAGKTVATATFSSSNVTLPLVLSANGVAPDAIKLLKVEPGTLAPMLASGRTDATINWITVAPLAGKVVAEAGKTLKVLPWSDYGFDGYGLSLFVSGKYLKANPDATRRFVAAFLQAERGAIDDPDGVAAALKAIVPEADEAVAKATWSSSIPLIKNSISEKDGYGTFEPALLKKSWEWVAKSLNQPIDKLDPETAIDRSILPKS